MEGAPTAGDTNCVSSRPQERAMHHQQFAEAAKAADLGRDGINGIFVQDSEHAHDGQRIRQSGRPSTIVGVSSNSRQKKCQTGPEVVIGSQLAMETSSERHS